VGPQTNRMGEGRDGARSATRFAETMQELQNEQAG
jgi:hypothetical protein